MTYDDVPRQALRDALTEIRQTRHERDELLALLIEARVHIAAWRSALKYGEGAVPDTNDLLPRIDALVAN